MSKAAVKAVVGTGVAVVTAATNIAQTAEQVNDTIDTAMNGIGEVNEAISKVNDLIQHVVQWDDNNRKRKSKSKPINRKSILKKGKILSNPPKSFRFLVWNEEAYNYHQLINKDLTEIGRISASSFAPNLRVGNEIYVYGIHLNAFVRSRLNEATSWHTAVLLSKTTQEFPGGTQFFKSDGATISETFSSSLSNHKFDTLGINTDLYEILYHRKQEIGPATNTSTTNSDYWYSGSGANPVFCSQSVYIPINRTVKYLNVDATSAVNAINVVCWGVRHNPANHGTATLDAFRVSLIASVDYKDTI